IRDATVTGVQTCALPIYPPSRIRVRGYGFLTELRREHEVTVMTQCMSEQELTDAEALRSQGYKVIVAQESKQQAALRSGRALLRDRKSTRLNSSHGSISY